MGDWIVKLPQTQRKPVKFHSTSRLDLVLLNLTTASNPIRLQTKATGTSSPPTSLPVQPGERKQRGPSAAMAASPPRPLLRLLLTLALALTVAAAGKISAPRTPISRDIYHSR